MVLHFLKVNIQKKYSSIYPFFLVCVFPVFYNVVFFSYLSLLIMRSDNVLLNETIVFLLVKRFYWCLLDLDNLFHKNIVKFRYFSLFVVLFAVIVQKYFMMFIEKLNENLIFSR